MTHALVTFTSDFGHDDWFVGVVHGVIGALAPGVTVVDRAGACLPWGDRDDLRQVGAARRADRRRAQRRGGRGAAARPRAGGRLGLSARHG